MLVERMERIERKLDALLQLTPADPDEAVGKRQAARMLHVNRSKKLKSLIDRGAIKTVNVDGQEKIAREEIRRVLREGTDGAGSAAGPATARRRRGRSPQKRQSVAEVSAGIRSIPIPRDDD